MKSLIKVKKQRVFKEMEEDTGVYSKKVVGGPRGQTAAGKDVLRAAAAHSTVSHVGHVPFILSIMGSRTMVCSDSHF